MSQPSGGAVSPFEVINARAGNLQHQTGSKAAEIAIVATIYSLFVLINFYYFARHRWTSKNLKGQRRIDLWSMALVSRHLWQVTTQIFVILPFFLSERTGMCAAANMFFNHFDFPTYRRRFQKAKKKACLGFRRCVILSWPVRCLPWPYHR
jgi:TRAP-type uncharacterized transport system fused permease subunit